VLFYVVLTERRKAAADGGETKKETGSLDTEVPGQKTSLES
jgi:hypothetical protein